MTKPVIGREKAMNHAPLTSKGFVDQKPKTRVEFCHATLLTGDVHHHKKDTIIK
jgi:hypothetical protein